VIDSTNDRARALALAGAPHGTLVTAAAQTAGRGRQGRRWSAPPGSALLFSLVLRWSASDRPPSLLPLIAAVAVCDAAAGVQARVKWPNDIVIERPGGPGRQTTLAKLAGILTESRPQEGWAVLGIGLNVAVRLEDLPEELHATAATMGEPANAIEPILTRLLEALGRWLGETTEALLDAYRARDALAGRAIEWGTARTGEERPGRGRAQGIDGEGRLVVALADGGHTTLGAGEVHLRAS
jgi:BirA family biotin operon repressor/biotin-[acetyl-CoA-carboxylase] ligase